MENIINNKPKVENSNIGTNSSIGGSLPKAQPTLNRQKSTQLSGATIKPGSPNKGPKTPAGIVQKPFETDKHADKRMNKMFAKTGQPTLGKWSAKNDSDAGPTQVKINPAFDKTKEINQNLANRQKIVNQGFSPATKPAQKYKWSEGLSDADNATINNALNKLAAWGGDKDLSKVNKQWGEDLGYQLRTDGLDEENANRLTDHFNKMAPEYNEVFPEYGQNSKAQNKSQNYYDSVSQDLEKGGWVNIDSGLLPYEHGFETDGNEDLAVDAKKTPDGKYALYMYPETENGPATGYEPEDNEPTYTFDTFDDMKAFIENGYQESEEKQRKQASKLFGTDLSKKTGPVYDPALGIAGSPSDIDDISKMQELIDSTLQKYGRIGAGMYDDLDANGYYLDANNKVRRK